MNLSSKEQSVMYFDLLLKAYAQRGELNGRPVDAECLVREFVNRWRAKDMCLKAHTDKGVQMDGPLLASVLAAIGRYVRRGDKGKAKFLQDFVEHRININSAVKAAEIIKFYKSEGCFKGKTDKIFYNKEAEKDLIRIFDAVNQRQQARG